MVDAPAPEDQKAPPPAPMVAKHDDSDHLAALNAILGDGSGEESAIRDAADRDRTRADQRQMSEYIAAAGRRQPARDLGGGPSDVSTEQLIQRGREKRAAALQKAQEKTTGNEDPSLQAWRQAEAEAARQRSARDAGELKRKTDEDTDKRIAGELKTREGDKAKRGYRGVALAAGAAAALSPEAAAMLEHEEDGDGS